jgi:hypothetical protein
LAIRVSLSKEISALVADLASDRAVVREAAIARLTVIGARAAGALAAIVADRRASPAARAAALRVFEATAAAEGLVSALPALDDPSEEIVRGAIAALAPHVRSADGGAVVDRLTAIALDRKRTPPIREAALRALLVLDRGSLKPLLKALRTDPAPDIAALVDDRHPPPEAPAELVARAVDGRLPAQAEPLRRALARAGETLTLPNLLTLVERLRDHERSVPAAARGEWQAARAAAHLVLARRGSRVALFDLRETVQQAKEPVAMEFLAALEAIGDASCVEALARACASTRDTWWRGHLAHAFRAIVRREKLTRRHAAIRRLKERDPRTLGELWPQ